MESGIPTDLLVSSCARLAGQEGVSVIVRQRGDATSGVIILKINYLDGTSQILSQIRIEDELVWSPRHPEGPIPENEAEEAIEQEMTFDPDAWVVEIEDRKGRHWFPGKVVSI